MRALKCSKEGLYQHCFGRRDSHQLVSRPPPRPKKVAAAFLILFSFALSGPKGKGWKLPLFFSSPPSSRCSNQIHRARKSFSFSPGRVMCLSLQCIQFNDRILSVPPSKEVPKAGLQRGSGGQKMLAANLLVESLYVPVTLHRSMLGIEIFWSAFLIVGAKECGGHHLGASSHPMCLLWGTLLGRLAQKQAPGSVCCTLHAAVGQEKPEIMFHSCIRVQVTSRDMPGCESAED